MLFEFFNSKIKGKYFGTSSLKITFQYSIIFVQKVPEIHCVKSIRIRSFSGPDFPAFGLNTERYRLFFRIQHECGKIRTRKTPDTDTFHEKIVVILQ